MPPWRVHSFSMKCSVKELCRLLGIALVRFSQGFTQLLGPDHLSLQKHFPCKALDHLRVDSERFLLAIRTSQCHSLVDQRQRYLRL